MSHFGQKLLYENGACRLFNVVMPGSATRRCKEYSSHVEGSLWRIGESTRVEKRKISLRMRGVCPAQLLRAYEEAEPAIRNLKPAALELRSEGKAKTQMAHHG